MEEALKIINECLFTNFDEVANFDKMERLSKLTNIRNFLYSNYAKQYNIKLFELIDDISLMIIDKKIPIDGDLRTVSENQDKEKEIINKINELRNSILNILVEESNHIFVAE